MLKNIMQNPKALAQRKKVEPETVKYIAYLEDFDQEQNFMKQLCSIVSEPIWYYTMIVLGMFSMIEVLACGIMSLKNHEYMMKKEDISYMCDVMWVVDHCLWIIGYYVEKKSMTIWTSLGFGLGLTSSIPFELIINGTPFLKTMLTMNRTLKIVYVLIIFNAINSKIKNTVFIRSVQAIYLMFFCILVLGFAYSIMNCYPNHCQNAAFSDEVHLFKIMHTIGGAITMRGFGSVYQSQYKQNTFLVVSTVIVFVFIFCMYTGYVTFFYFVGAYHKSSFRFNYLSIKQILQDLDMDHNYMEKINDFFDCMWRICKGYDSYMAETRISYPFLQFESILPLAYRTDIQMDICMGALVHSKIFSDLNLDFLKELSCYMKQQIYVHGQYVFHKDELKDKMIYILKGTLNILSEEDGEAPLVTLTNGTCLAETTILISYKSTFKCQCLTRCVLQVLERKHFIEVARRYLSQFRNIRKKVHQRYKEVRKLHDLKLAIRNLNDDVIYRPMSTAWLKHTLHKVMGSKSRDAATKHAIQTFNLRSEIDDTTFNFRLYTARYLRLYVLAERIRLNRDTLFVKSSFPYLLRPNTKLILIWEILICIIACVATIHIPYTSFILKDRTATFYASIYMYTIIWWLDIILQLRTAIKMPSNQQIITSMLYILILRLKTFVFAMDLLSCIPVECMSGIFQVKTLDHLYVNRIFKLVRVIKLLQKMEDYFNTNPIISRIITVTIVLFFSSYLLGCYYFSIRCLNQCDTKEILTLIFYSLQIVTGATVWVPDYTELEDYVLMNIIMFIVLAIAFPVIYAYIFSAFAFSEIHRSTICQNTDRLIQALKHFSPHLIEQVKSIVYTETDIYNGINFFNKGYIFKILPKPLVGILFKRFYIRWMMTLPIFYGLPKYVVIDVLQTAAQTTTICPGTVIMHVGDLIKELFILCEGHCEHICGVNKTLKKINGRQSLNDMEVMLNLPSRKYVRAITHCKMVIIDFLEMRKVLLKYPNVPSIEFIVEKMGTMRNKILKFQTTQVSLPHSYKYMDRTLRTSLIQSIAESNKQYNSKKRMCTRFWSFIMHSTIHPEGKFFIRWEYFRCLSAIVASILYPTTFLIFLPMVHPLKLILLATDIAAIIDILIRFHVGYYNANGILITQSMMTAVHYLKTSFLIDVIGILPTQYIVTMNKYILITTTHLFQLYRYFGFIYYNVSNSSVPNSKKYMLSIMPIYIVFLNISSSVYVSLECKINPNLPYERCLICNGNSIFGKNKMQENITPLVAHMYAFYMIINTMSTISFQGYSVNDPITMAMASIFAILGFYWNIFLAVTAFKFFMLENMSSFYDNKIKQTVNKFLSRYKVPKTIDKTVNRFIRTGMLLDKFNVHDTLSSFPTELRRDVLFEKFGKDLMQSCLCNSEDFEPFIRNILVHSEHKYVVTNGLIYHTNDIVSDTIFIISGTVEFLLPGGAVACFLQPGAIIGNLCCLTYNRMMSNIVAVGNVEMITVKSTKFFQILQHFPSTMAEFNRIKAIHWNHIPGARSFVYINRFTHASKYMLNISVIIWHRIFVIYLLFFGNYFSQLVYLYQVAVSEFSWIILVVNIVLDISYVISVASDFFIPIETTTGIILEVRLLSHYWFRQPLFWLNVFAALPLSISLEFMTLTPKMYYYLFVILRLNVMLRTEHLITYYKRIFLRLKVNVLYSKIIMLMLISSLFIMSTLALFMLFCEISAKNMSEHINRQFLIGTTALNRLKIFGMWFKVISDAFTHSSQTYFYPVSVAYVTIIIVMDLFIMLSLSVFYAIVISLILASKQVQWYYMYALDRLDLYLSNNRVSAATAEKIRSYSEVIWKNTMGVKYSTMLNKLPSKLQETLLSYMVGDLVFNSKSIFQNCHEDFKRQLMPLLDVEFYLKGDYVQTKGTIDNTMYWVRTGTVVRLSELNDYSHDIVDYFTEGNCFGISQGILHAVPHMFSYKAYSDCCVISLRKCDWEQLIAYFPASRRILSRAAKVHYTEEKKRYLDIHNLPFHSEIHDYEEGAFIVEQAQFRDDPHSDESLYDEEAAENQK